MKEKVWDIRTAPKTELGEFQHWTNRIQTDLLMGSLKAKKIRVYDANGCRWNAQHQVIDHDDFCSCDFDEDTDTNLEDAE